MHKYLLTVAVILSITPLFITCNGSLVLPPENLDDLELRFLSGTIGADLQPFVPPDPVVCQVVVVAKNRSPNLFLTGLRIQAADVVLQSTNTKLGAINFSTSWDGFLNPGEEDTVRLVKVMSDRTLFSPPCRHYVHLNIVVSCGYLASKTIQTDSLLFACVY